jgi:hypothetical protein
LQALACWQALAHTCRVFIPCTSCKQARTRRVTSTVHAPTICCTHHATLNTPWAPRHTNTHTHTTAAIKYTPPPDAPTAAAKATPPPLLARSPLCLAPPSPPTGSSAADLPAHMQMHECTSGGSCGACGAPARCTLLNDSTVHSRHDQAEHTSRESSVLQGRAQPGTGSWGRRTKRARHPRRPHTHRRHARPTTIKRRKQQHTVTTGQARSASETAAVVVRPETQYPTHMMVCEVLCR